jgi:protein adenylyltransferase
MPQLVASFTNSYARLPEHFFARLDPTPVARPRLITLNRSLAQELGLATDALEPETLAAIFGGNLVPTGAEPISMAYAGHQFGSFVPQLGAVGRFSWAKYSIKAAFAATSS